MYSCEIGKMYECMDNVKSSSTYDFNSSTIFKNFKKKVIQFFMERINYSFSLICSADFLKIKMSNI